MSSSLSVNAIFGSGRSGSTWLGSIINSHPGLIYRFEPFHRLSAKEPVVQYYKKLLKEDSISENQLSDSDIPKIYKSLVSADPLTDKPPFFPKSDIDVLGPEKEGIRKKSWAVARSLPVFDCFYKKLYTPKNSPPLVFKEVTFEKQMRNILKYTSIPVVYLVRHPCGNILSDVKGQESGKMPTGRQSVLESILKKHDVELFDKYGHQLEQLSILEKTTLLWRIDLETGLKALNDFGRGLLITYEQLCDDAHTHVQPIFKTFNLPYSSQTEQFLDTLYASDKASMQKNRRSQDWMNQFFTVYRNPKKQKYSWKNKIEAEDRQKIEAIVQDSWAFQHCAKVGQWD